MNISIKLIIASATLGAAVYTGAIQTALPEARLTVHVVDDDGAAVPGATVRLGFKDPVSRKDIVVSGITDANGNYTGQGASGAGVLGCDIAKRGYYQGGISNPPFLDAVAGRWQPWDKTYISILRKIENPIPMYARRVTTDIPAADMPCGYDLEAGDWVAPWGRGKISDFIFTLKRDYRNRQEFNVSVSLSFSNPRDGIQKTELPKEFSISQFKWPRQAPLDKYEAAFALGMARTSQESGITASYEREGAYFFRVRTVERDGQIVSALYGKIFDGIRLDPMNAKNCIVLFTYYLNPTSKDRNMEFDLEKNLFTNLKDDEKPRNP